MTWPKKIPESTPEEKIASDKFMKIWQEIARKKYQGHEHFGHEFIAKRQRNKEEYVLEIGAGVGEHIPFEKSKNYYAADIRDDFVKQIQNRFPHVKGYAFNIERKTPFPNDFFDRVITIHLLEHLPNLPVALNEICRIMKPDGELDIIIPCEGSLAHKIAREISSKREFQKRFPNIDYDKIMANQHVNNIWEILQEIKSKFDTIEEVYYPSILKLPYINLTIGMALKKK